MFTVVSKGDADDTNDLIPVCTGLTRTLYLACATQVNYLANREAPQKRHSHFFEVSLPGHFPPGKQHSFTLDLQLGRRFFPSTAILIYPFLHNRTTFTAVWRIDRLKHLGVCSPQAIGGGKNGRNCSLL